MTDYREQQRKRADVDALKLKTGSNVWLMRRGATLANDAAETALFSKTLWGGVLSTGNLLMLEQHISYLNNSGVNRTFTFKFKYGSTTLFTDAAVYGTSANYRFFIYRIKLIASGATNSQLMTVERVVGTELFLTTTLFAGVATSAEDSTTDLAVSMTWQHSAAAATVTVEERLTLANFVGAVS